MLIRVPDWKLVYFDHAAVIFIQKTEYEKRQKQFDSLSLSATRFASLNDPIELARIFDIYSQFYALNDMKLILKYYTTNVSSMYIFRDNHIKGMIRVLNKVGDELKKKDS
jgi:hypothetical protein